MNAAAAGEVPNCLIDKGVDGVSSDSDVVVTDHCLDMELGDVACLWEAETTEPASTGPVKGRLKERRMFWKEEIQAPTFVLDTIEAGYVLPLKTNPTPFSRQNQASALGNAEFVEESVAGLLTSGCIKEVDSIPYICSPLSVVESSGGKKRLVINLRHLNRFLWKQKFKYEDLRVAMLLFEKGDSPLTSSQGTIMWILPKPIGSTSGLPGGGGKYFVFTVLPFGLSTACYIFTKLLRPLVRYWRAKGLRIVVYLDDGLCAATGHQSALEASELVRSTLE